MKPYEEIKFQNGYLRWIREGNEYVCRMSEEYMERIKLLHEEPKREWVGLTADDLQEIIGTGDSIGHYIKTTEAKLKEKNHAT